MRLRLKRLAYRRLIRPMALRIGLSRTGLIYESIASKLGAKSITGIVDGGAYDGEVALYLAELFPRAIVYAFEPTPPTFDVLVSTARNHPRIISVNAAIGSEMGKAKINHNRLASTNSLKPSLHDNSAEDMFMGRGDTLQSFDIDVITLDNFFEPKNQRIDFIKLDVQGYEIEALKGAESVLSNAKAVMTEVRFFPLYEADSLFQDIDFYLSERGFALQQICEVTHRPSNRQAFEANAFWLKV